MKKSKKNILFIINPISGISKKKDIPQLVKEELNQENFHFTISYTKYAGHGNEIALNECNNYDAIVVVGGDGSINEIGSALIGSKCILGIIPSGSGNGFARHHKIPLKPKAAIQLINQWKIEKIDIGRLNNRYFFANCGIGFDAHIAHQFDLSKKRGFINYIRLVIKEYKLFKPFTFSYVLDGEPGEAEVILANASNCSQFGNNFYISPLSITNDGSMEFVLLKRIPFRKSIAVGLRFFFKKIEKSEYYTSLSFKNSLNFNVPGNIKIQLDGDPTPYQKQIKIEIFAEHFSLLMP